jgi:hypothetical protein
MTRWIVLEEWHLVVRVPATVPTTSVDGLVTALASARGRQRLEHTVQRWLRMLPHGQCGHVRIET